MIDVIDMLIMGNHQNLTLTEDLPDSPIVLFHEHEQKDISQTSIIFEKKTVS
jgi:hypothetical protein